MTYDDVIELIGMANAAHAAGDTERHAEIWARIEREYMSIEYMGS